MRQLRLVILAAVLAAAAAACGNAASTPSSSSSAAASSSAQPSAAPATSSPSAAVSASPAGPVPIVLKEWSVAVTGALKAGSASFTITNSGTVPHELLVFKSDLDPSAYPMNSAGDIIEDGPGVTLVSDGENIEPGGTQSRTVDLSAAGTYLVVCNIPGHFKQGMFTVLTVTQ